MKKFMYIIIFLISLSFVSATISFTGDPSLDGETLSASYTYNVAECSTAAPCTVNLNIDGQGVNSTPVTETSGSGSLSVTMTASGEKQIQFVIAKPSGGSVSSNIKKIFIDVTAPVSTPISFYRTGMPLTAITSRATVPLTFVFNITEDKLRGNIEFNFSEFTTDFTTKRAYAKYEKDFNEICSFDSQVYSCTIADFYVHISKPEIRYFITMTDDAGNTNAQEFQVSFSLDDTIPVVESITTPGCRDGKCYVSGLQPTPIFITLDSASTDFSMRLIQYIIQGNNYQVAKCESNVCSGTGSPVCNSGESIVLTIHPDSQDDAGNRLAGKNSETFTCDSEPPEVTIDDIKTESIYPSGEVEQDGDFQLIVNVTDDFGKVYASVDTQGLNGGGIVNATCENITAVKSKCTFNLKAGSPASVNLDIILSDIAGNRKSITYPVIILGTIDAEPNNWKIKSKDHSPKILNQYHSYLGAQVHTWVKLENLRGDVDLVSVEPGQCIEVDPNTSCSAFMDVAGKGPKLLSLPYDRNPLLLFRFRQGNIPADADGKLRCNCSIKLLSKKASKIYSKKETETFIMEWDVENIAAIHEHLAQEINLTQVEMRKELETLMRFEAFVKLGKSICGITKPIEITGAALSVTGNILQIPPPTKAAGKALVESGEKTGVFGENLFGGKNGIFKQFCSFFTCKRNNPITNAINPDKLFPGGETMAKWAGYDNVSMAMNPHRSIVWSVVYLCAPGFVDSMKRKQATDCHYVHCLQSMANSGFSPASCSNMRSYMHCRYFTGEIFQAVPYSALLGNIVGKVRTALSNPVGLVFSALSVSCSTIKVFPGKGVCNILAETSKIGNLVRQGKEIYTSIVEFDMGGIVGKSSTNAEEYCDEIRGEFPPLTPPQLDRQYNSPFAGREIVLDNNEKYNCDYITCRTGNIYTVRTSSTESETFVMHPDGYLVNFNQHFAANYQNAQIDFNKAQIDYNKFMTDFPNEDKWDEYVQDSMSPYWSDDFRWQTGTPGWIIEAADTLYDEKLAQMNEPFENAQANLNDMQKVIQNADINGLSVDDINNLKAPDEIAATIQSKQNTIKTDGETAQSKFMTSLSTTLLKNIENQANRNAMQTLIDTIETTQSEWNTARKRWAQGQAELSRLQSELSGCQDDACRNRLRGLIDTKENEVNGEDGLRAVANKAEDAYVAAVNDASSEHKFNQVWRNPESAVIVGTILNNGVIGAEIGNLLGGGFDNVMISEIDEFFQEGWGKWFTEDGFAEEICKRGKTDQKPVANVPLINMDGYMMSAIHVEGQVTEKQDANQNIIYDYFASLEVSMKKAGLDWEVLLKADGKPDLSMEMNESLLTTIQRTPLTSSVLYINSTSKYSKVCFKAHEDIAPYFDEFEETVYPLVDWQQGRPNSEFCVPLTTYAFD